jgi:hypothetical protein
MMLLTWPFHGLVAIVNEIVRQAEEAMYDETALQQELKALYARLESGQIAEGEFERRENELAERLAKAEEFHRQQRRRAH